VTAQQQTRAEAAQQAQLPLQLTKELANEQVAEKVQMMMSKNLKNLDIRLDPPELGRMQIRMTMNNDLANVHFTVTNPQARDIIEQTLPRLREMLAQQGMQLADSSVQQQSSGQQQSGYAAAEQNGQGASERGFSGQSDENFDADVNLDLNVVSKRDGISFYA
ncbi:flagellar hook-length control protein FliK, partial [Vibrio parahaemolyticus]